MFRREGREGKGLSKMHPCSNWLFVTRLGRAGVGRGRGVIISFRCTIWSCIITFLVTYYTFIFLCEADKRKRETGRKIRSREKTRKKTKRRGEMRTIKERQNKEKEDGIYFPETKTAQREKDTPWKRKT